MVVGEGGRTSRTAGRALSVRSPNSADSSRSLLVGLSDRQSEKQGRVRGGSPHLTVTLIMSYCGTDELTDTFSDILSPSPMATRCGSGIMR